MKVKPVSTDAVPTITGTIAAGIVLGRELNHILSFGS